MNKCHLPLLLSLALALAGPTLREASAQTNTNPPSVRAATTLPATALTVRKGLRVELVAGGNLVESPVAMAFDERGRLYVAESRGQPAGDPGERRGGRIRLNFFGL